MHGRAITNTTAVVAMRDSQYDTPVLSRGGDREGEVRGANFPSCPEGDKASRQNDILRLAMRKILVSCDPTPLRPADERGTRPKYR